jgi:hypothetical protein
MSGPRQENTEVLDFQMLARIMQLAQLRERHLSRAAEIEDVLEELRGSCSPRLRRTIDRLSLFDSTRMDRADQYHAGQRLAKN